jgi:hypothetical protein
MRAAPYISPTQFTCCTSTAVQMLTQTCGQLPTYPQGYSIYLLYQYNSTKKLTQNGAAAEQHVCGAVVYAILAAVAILQHQPRCRRSGRGRGPVESGTQCAVDPSSHNQKKMVLVPEVGVILVARLFSQTYNFSQINTNIQRFALD